jgi:hypothetical protein
MFLSTAGFFQVRSNMDFRNRSTKVIRSTWSVLSNILTKMQRGGQDSDKNTDNNLSKDQINLQNVQQKIIHVFP